MAINAVIFDYDGVIADSKDMIYDIADGFLQLHGIRLDKTKILTGSAKETFRNAGLESRLQEFMPFLKSESIRRFREVDVFPGMQAVLAELEQNYSIGIVSNGFKDFIDRHLSFHGMAGRIKAVVDGSEIRVKPDPYQIIKCLSLLGARPDESCYIGDTDTDVIAARAAGIGKVIAVSYGFHGAERLKNADVIIHRPESIITALKG
ncbi:MAG: HAD family hydrolase [Candidatus Aenigmarchaeota archaeon]|nr:HAD family hydrolase [Candidatus Aenigmarchaeota archaeon]